VIADGANGFLVGQKNERQLAEKISLLLSNKQMRKRFGAKGSEIANRRFNWGKISEKTIEVYNLLLKKK
jgi:glycosyltransferase involved in cell wall biosynthesis